MTLAVIGTFYARHEQSLPLMHRLFVDGSRKPDETWLMCETTEDADAIHEALDFLYEHELIETRVPRGARIELLPTPKADGAYTVLPYAHKINAALDESVADLIVYLDNGSMPGPDKYRVMAEALENHPEWGAVYCTQKRTGWSELTAYADVPVADAFCALNYTQVMHRRTADRWPLSMSLANPDIADGVFWRYLHQSLGDFYPAGGKMIHDDHHIPTTAATLA